MFRLISGFAPALILAPALLLATAPATASTTGPETDPLGEIQLGRVDPTLGPAIALVQKGAFDEAIAKLTSLRALTDDTPQLMELLGLAYGATGRIEESLAAFDRALALEQGLPTIHTNKGIVLMTIGRIPEAAEAFEAALALDGSDRRAHQRLGLIKLARGEVKPAIAHLEAGIEGTPRDYFGVKGDLARAYLDDGLPGRAIALLAPFVGREDAPDRALLLAGEAYRTTGETDRAREAYTRLAERGTRPEAHVALARMALAELDFAGAEAVLQEGAQAFPADPVIRFELGNVYGAQGRYEDALAEYRAGLAEAPDMQGLLKAASLAHYRTGDLEAAEDHAARLAALPGAASSDLTWQATLREARGDAAGAEALYREAIAMNGEDWLAMNNLAALIAESAPLEAVELAGAAARLAPENRAVADTLGWARLQARDLDGAHEVFSALAEADPQDPGAAYRLGLVFKEMGRPDEARRELQRALELDEGFRYADEARETLSQL